jgi:hypothetical protein
MRAALRSVGTRRSQLPRRLLLVDCLAAGAIGAALGFWSPQAAAQVPSSDSSVDLLQPAIPGNPANPPRFSRQAQLQDKAPADATFTAPTTIGAIPTYGAPAAFGAGDTGFDATNTGRRNKRLPASAAKNADQAQSNATFQPVPNFASAPPPKPVPPAPSPPPEVYPAKAADRPGAILPLPPEPPPVSNPPTQVYPRAAARRPGAVLPIPPAADFEPSAETPPPGTPPPNTLPLGTARQRPLPIAEGDPYAPLGLRAGSFLIYPAVELSAGYDSNAERVPGGRGSALFVVAPELQVQSDWSRHSLKADIRGTYTEYGADLQPSLNRPYLDGTIDGRIDVSRDTQVLLENRFLVSTDNPGSPNLTAGLAKLPIYTSVGGTAGLAQQFNRLQVTAKGTIDRSTYQNSVLTDGEVSSNADRDFNQYGGILRLGYELDPALKPFVEVDADERIHDEQFDRSGLQRDSTGKSAKLGADIDLFGSLTGEIAAGYLERIYKDPTLPNVSGVIADGSLIWQATALTTAKLTAASTVNESILPGSSGALSRDFSIQVDHAFLRWFVGTLLMGYGRDDYVGLERQDNRYFASAGFTFKLNRDVQLKGTVRQDWLTSTAPGVAYDATSFLVGARLQR